MSERMQTVHVRINDAATGQPTPCRVRFTDAVGNYCAPFGRLTEFATDGFVEVGGNVEIDREAWAYIDGTCEIELPPGTIIVRAAKGPEYRPLREEVTLTPGKLSLRLMIERWADLRAEGWYSGDTHCEYPSPQTALLEGAAEDVAVVNLLARETAARDRPGRAIPNILDFSGQRTAAERPGHIVAVNTINSHSQLGTLRLLNCHRVVYPLTFGGPQGFDNWTLMDWCDQCHRKGGLVVGAEFFDTMPDTPHGELLPNLITGRIDALEIGSFDNPEVNAKLGQGSEFEEWYRLLDCGFRIPLVARSSKMCNLDVLGQPRTYAHLGPNEPLTYKGWIEAVRAGRTFVTSGPLLMLQANGQLPGAILDLTDSASVLKLRAEARSLKPFHKVEIVVNNRVVASAAAHGDPATATAEVELPLPEGGWVVARCYGDYDVTMERWIAAQTSPVYVRVEGRTPRPDPAVIDGFLAKLRAMLTWVEREGRFEDDKQRRRLARVFEEACSILEKRRA